MSPKLIKSGLLEMHLLLFLVSCGDSLVHGRWPPCAILWSHVCGLERSELNGETGSGDATQRAEPDPQRHEGPISNRALFFIPVHFTCDKIIALSTPNIVYYASNWETQTEKAVMKLSMTLVHVAIDAPCGASVHMSVCLIFLTQPLCYQSHYLVVGSAWAINRT